MSPRSRQVRGDCPNSGLHHISRFGRTFPCHRGVAKSAGTAQTQDCTIFLGLAGLFHVTAEWATPRGLPKLRTLLQISVWLDFSMSPRSGRLRGDCPNSELYYKSRYGRTFPSHRGLGDSAGTAQTQNFTTNLGMAELFHVTADSA